MAKYLLASASGMGFLCLIAGLSPVQALPSLEITDKNVAVNQDDGSYQKNDSHQSNLTNNISSKLLIANESQKNLSSVNQQPKNQDLEVDSAVNFWQPIIPQSASSSPTSYKLAQVTSVSQLSDVQPNDWAFQALQSLVERYGCIAGYPNQTYRGNRAITRYEFAAGLNACLDRINELIATATGDLVKKEDLATLQKLQEQFAAELATLRGRVDAVEARTAELEANQFSTTTKLSGEAIIAGVGASGGAPNSSDSNIILVNRVRLNLTTSFTGKDLLITGLQAYNFLGGATGEGSLQQSLGLPAPLSASSARTSFEPQFPGLNVNTSSLVGANSVQVYKLLYIFPVANKLTLFAGTAAETSDAFPAITPFYGEGQESISRFAGLNPVVRISGGTSGTGLASAAGFIFNISPNLDLRALYGNPNANLTQKSANEAEPGVSNTPLGAGLFSGSSVIATQLTFKPSAALDIGLNYAHSYHEINILGTGLVSSDIDALAGVATGTGTPVTLNSVGGTLTWRLSPKIALSGYGAALFVDAASNSVNASTTFTSWMAGVHFRDLFKSGNTAGIIFGQPLFRSDTGGSAQLTPTGENRATPYHLEGYYRLQVTDNISITPGAFVLFNPEGNSKNDTTTVGVLRTTFTF